MTRGDGFRHRLEEGPPVLLDGPTGTELERLGVDTAGPLWSTRAVLERPGQVAAVHGAYAGAGAEVLTAVTFRAHRDRFERVGLDRDDRDRVVGTAVRLARAAADAGPRRAWVAASLGPLGDCYAPEEVPDDAVLVREHQEQAAVLAAAGPDLILVETMNTQREAVAAALAAHGTGLPTLVGFIVDRGGRLLSGEPLDAAVAAVGPYADAVLLNCSALPAVEDAVPILAGTGRPWGAYANGSLTVPHKGWSPGPDVDPGRYAQAAQRWVVAGARLVGSCCGTTAEHTRRLHSLFGAL